MAMVLSDGVGRGMTLEVTSQSRGGVGTRCV